MEEQLNEANIKHLFGSLKRKMSGQEFKDFVRKGWNASAKEKNVRTVAH